MSHTVISVENLGKEYVIGARENGADSFREMIASAAAAPFRRLRRFSGNVAPEERIWALKNVSFEVVEGEVFGIIGRNGAGKSTLLKILSRITEPTEGRAEIRGRVASLLEVGTGFHGELTGRENVYLNGAILGMSRAEIDRKFDEIVDFSGVEKFLDTPVKRYSSGMYVRLAFSVAAHLEPEILIVDEVLSVGDISFQRKCLGRMESVVDSGRSVLIVSHNMAIVSALCRRLIVLHRGQLTYCGNVSEGYANYDYLQSSETNDHDDFGPNSRRFGTGRIQFNKVELREPSGSAVSQLYSGQDCRIELSCTSQEELTDVSFQIGILDRFDSKIAIVSSTTLNKTYTLRPGENVIRCEIGRLPLYPGDYNLAISATRRQELLDGVSRCKPIRVEYGDFYGTGRLPDYGPLLLDYRWK